VTGLAVDLAVVAGPFFTAIASPTCARLNIGRLARLDAAAVRFNAWSFPIVAAGEILAEAVAAYVGPGNHRR